MGAHYLLVDRPRRAYIVFLFVYLPSPLSLFLSSISRDSILGDFLEEKRRLLAVYTSASGPRCSKVSKVGSVNNQRLGETLK